MNISTTKRVMHNLLEFCSLFYLLLFLHKKFIELSIAKRLPKEIIELNRVGFEGFAFNTTIFPLL